MMGCLAYPLGAVAIVLTIGVIARLINPYPNPDATILEVVVNSILALILAAVAWWSWSRRKRSEE